MSAIACGDNVNSRSLQDTVVQIFTKLIWSNVCTTQYIRIHGRQFYSDVRHEAFTIMMLYDRGEENTLFEMSPLGINAMFYNLYRYIA